MRCGGRKEGIKHRSWGAEGVGGVGEVSGREVRAPPKRSPCKTPLPSPSAPCPALIYDPAAGRTGHPSIGHRLFWWRKGGGRARVKRIGFLAPSPGIRKGIP